MEVVSFTPGCFYLQRKNPEVPIGYEVWWALDPIWTLWREEKILLC
jgi:hypothetical protein